MSDEGRVTISGFLLARIAEDEADARHASIYADAWTEAHDTWQHVQADGHNVISGAESVLPHVSRWDPARVLAECAAKRAIVEFHESWPVLVREPEEIAEHTTPLVVRMSQRISWLTQQEYVRRFGAEPPTAPMLAALAAVYADHPDYRQEWAL